MVENKRIPLEPGTKLTEDITIKKLLSDEGGTALTYIAEEDGYEIVIKEFFPYQSSVPVYRDDLGKKIISSMDATMLCKELEEMLEREINNSKDVNKAPEGNSVFFFPCIAIASEKLLPDFNNTIARYEKIKTLQGKTLKTYIDELEKKQGASITLNQILTLTSKTLFSLKQMHEKDIINLDIKPDNLYFPTQFSLDGTYCIFLDCGSYQKSDNIRWISSSRKYTPYEIQKAIRYSNHSKTFFEIYCGFIGKHSDVFSVGAILFELLFKEGLYSNGMISTARELKNRVDKKTREVIGTQYPYLEKRLANLLCKAMAIPQNVQSKKDFEDARYTADEFLKEVEIILEILENKGIHEEIVEHRSREQYIEILKRTGNIQEGNPNNEDLLTKDDIFNKDWFPEAIIEK